MYFKFSSAIIQVMKTKEIQVGLDLDGVVAKHSLGGFWVKVRIIKEAILKGAHSKKYYFPKTKLEQLAWIVINWCRVPDKKGTDLLKSLAQKNFCFFLISSRLKFNYPSTIKWLKKYGLFTLFKKVLLNTKDENPIYFKVEKIKSEKIDFFIDDDLEVLIALCQTKAKLFWIVPGHKNGDENHENKIINCNSYKEALEKIVIGIDKGIC